MRRERCVRCNRDVTGRSHVFADSTGWEGPYCGRCADVVREARAMAAVALEIHRREEEDEADAAA